MKTLLVCNSCCFAACDSKCHRLCVLAKRHATQTNKTKHECITQGDRLRQKTRDAMYRSQHTQLAAAHLVDAKTASCLLRPPSKGGLCIFDLLERASSTSKGLGHIPVLVSQCSFFETVQAARTLSQQAVVASYPAARFYPRRRREQEATGNRATASVGQTAHYSSAPRSSSHSGLR